MEISGIKELADRIKANISKVIIGKDEIIEYVVVALFCSGHVLLEDVPGLGKTVLAKCLAKSIDCDFKRIQFTPDLLPTDITGINYFSQKLNEFVLRKGPIFSNIILADEINRATPRTQASLLECMEERQVTIDGETEHLAKPFFVIATQNPVETHGTFPLPEAQLDRFIMRLSIGYPNVQEGRQILDRFQIGAKSPEIECVAHADEVVGAVEAFTDVKINDALKNYIIDIVEMTRKSDRISLGVSPRGSLALMKASQAYAAIKGRDFVTPDDVKHVAVPVLAHRLILRGHAITTSGSKSSEAAIEEILRTVQVPVENI